MRCYFFGDIHGNNYALEKCLSHIDEVAPQQIYCLGDLVGWLPFGDRTLKRMRAHNFPTVAGNHDLLVAGVFTDHAEQLDRMQASAYNAGILSTVSGACTYLSGLPLEIETDQFTVVHHSPFHLPVNGRRPTINAFNYLDAKELRNCLGNWLNHPKQLIFSGHDHIPAVYELSSQIENPTLEDVNIYRPKGCENLTVRVRATYHYWIKAGSVGGPYRDEVPLANSVLYDDTEETITLIRLSYPKEELAREFIEHPLVCHLPTIRRYLQMISE